MNVICRFCSAFRFQRELLNCCHNGKVRLPSLQECPLLLRRLLECDNREARNYRDNVRNYNAAFSFASLDADVIMPPERGPYCFRLQGQTYHFISGLHQNNDERKKYGQWIAQTIRSEEAKSDRFPSKRRNEERRAKRRAKGKAKSEGQSEERRAKRRAKGKAKSEGNSEERRENRRAKGIAKSEGKSEERREKRRAKGKAKSEGQSEERRAKRRAKGKVKSQLTISFNAFPFGLLAFTNSKMNFMCKG
ncbi:hypothetical protein FHG87_008830 [Trinorchestia longiramus]|nr:hypothetical protein FHG87_008830 [Trinorchestia longiramus]